MTLAARFFHWHRWAGYLIALQVLAWVLGGLLFAWLPFQGWVKSADVLVKPQQPLPAEWPRALDGLPVRGPLLSVQSVATASGPAFKLRDAQGERWWSAAGGELPLPDAASIGRYARTLYRGDGALVSVQRLAESPRKLGVVRELGDRNEAWLASFNDPLGTRLYFDVSSGELLAARNDAWVVYDFFFRLHVMDYEGGDDFNNKLLRAASVAAMALVATGLTLTLLALRRTWRRRRKH